jgi:AcrR family transcriptional regulator
VSQKVGRPGDPNAKVDLLRAAEEVFVARGFDAAKVEDITERAGHSKGAFYLHFRHKEDAFRQIVESLLARLGACIDEDELFPGNVHHPSALIARWRDKDVEVFDFIWSNRRLMRLCLEGGHSAAWAYLIDEFAERSRQKTKLFLAWGIAQKLFRADLDVELASLALSGAYDRVARALVRAERKPNLARTVGGLQRIVMAGLGSASLIRVLDSQVTKPRTTVRASRIQRKKTRAASQRRSR